jgi:hypothetical protein
MITPPTTITDERQATQGEVGIPNSTDMVDSFSVGANGVTLHLSGNVKFDIAFQVNSPDIQVGETLHVYASVDGTIWQNTNDTCVIDEQKLCTFSSQDV